MSTAEHDAILTIAVRAVVHRVLDLTDDATLRALDLVAADLRSDWEREQDVYVAGRGPMPPTQILALTAHLSGLFAGIKYPSARSGFGTNLVVFPVRLQKADGELLEVVDSAGHFSQRLPP